MTSQLSKYLAAQAELAARLHITMRLYSAGAGHQLAAMHAHFETLFLVEETNEAFKKLDLKDLQLYCDLNNSILSAARCGELTYDIVFKKAET